MPAQCTVFCSALGCSLLSVGTVEPGAGTVQEWVSRSGVCGMFGRYRKPPLEPTYNTLQKATSGKATPAAGDHLQACSTFRLDLAFWIQIHVCRTTDFKKPWIHKSLLRAPPLWPAFDTKHSTSLAIAMVETHGI